MIYVSPAYEKIWGNKRENLYKSPQSFLDAIYPEDRQRLLQETELYNDKEIMNIEYRIFDSEGSIHWIQDRRFPIKDNEGNLFKIAGVATDITDRKNTEEELKKYRCKLEDLVKKRTSQLTETNKQLQREMSERKRGEEKITLAYTELKQIFNAAADGMCVIDGYQLKPGQYNLIVSILRLSIIRADAHNGWKGLIPYIYWVSRLTSVA